MNGRKVNRPAFVVRKGDVVEMKEKSKKISLVVQSAEKGKVRGAPAWLDVDHADLQARVLEPPSLVDSQIDINAQQIVELYSK